MPSTAGALPGKKQQNIQNKKARLNTGNNGKEGTGKLVSGPMDSSFFIIIMILLVMGIIMMFSAGYAWAIKEGYDGTYYFKRQSIMALLGLTGMLIMSFFDYHYLRKAWIAYGAYIGAVILLVLCKVGPFKSPHNNSYRWLNLKIIPEFQPSEIMKFAIILLFSYIISVNYSKMKQFKYGILPFCGFLGVVCILMFLQPHLSGIIIICALGVMLMFIGGAKLSQLLLIGGVGVAGITGIVFYLATSKGFTYFEKRILSWRDPFNPAIKDITWQTQNSLIAIGSGGLFGLGLGNSRQKFLYLPESKNDFVFAIVCEELGFVGALMVIILFLLFIIRGFYIASKAPDKFGMLLAAGLTFQIGLQALLNIAVVTNTIPNTGVSLPFFSYGGTALVMQLVQMGIILNISRQSMIET